MMKFDKLIVVVLFVFWLNGLLIEWGNIFVGLYGLISVCWQVLGVILMVLDVLNILQIVDMMGIMWQVVLKQINVLIDEGLVLLLFNLVYKCLLLYVLMLCGEVVYQVVVEQWQWYVCDIVGDVSFFDFDVVLCVLLVMFGVYGQDGYVQLFVCFLFYQEYLCFSLS